MRADRSELTISRFIKAAPSQVWKAWTMRDHFEKWWIPAPMECKAIKLDLRPGGGFETQMRQPGEEFQPHLEGCFLAIIPEELLVFTTALTEGWRPFTPWLSLTAIMTLTPQDGGTLYSARVLHKDAEDSKKHEEMGFQEGWGTTIEQLAGVAEGFTKNR